MSKACHIAHALVLLSALSTLPAQQPISLSGTLRLANLTVPAALPFTPDPGAPPVFLAAYGDGGSALPASFPSIPTGYNPSHGVDARLTLEGASIDLTTAETIFYVLTDTGFLVSLSDPNLRIRTLTGTWARPDDSGNLTGVRRKA